MSSSSSLSRSNGRPEPEVIMNFADGFAYSKGKLEEAFRNGLLDKPAVKFIKDSGAPAKREDVDFIVHELEITRSQAEKALHDNGGDIVKALQHLITPQFK
ncbi:hypothetical protein EUX98_g3082 [Antrodiella citrinella]|uniref:Nascent polypeptide-associated complex subunit alpha-like UBA domain-containing protein n=1 Tax=Antrodiella citrinella TaxID=2447956 RepID=A0A4S4MXG5_9APHY|nr:hypothetical protein EUX98_g3082 [Antrodiella citrinella]